MTTNTMLNLLIALIVKSLQTGVNESPHRVSRPNKPLLTGGSPNVEIMLSGECSEIGWGHRNEHRDEMNLGGRVTARLPESRKIN